MSALLQFDGGSKPNPGKCAGAYVIYEYINKEKIIAEGGIYISHGTNNVGENSGLLSGLERCLSLGIKNLVVEGDSLLVVSQVSGKWKVKNDRLYIIFDKIITLVKMFDIFEIRHIRREYNYHADKQSDKTIELEKNWEN